MISYSFAPFVLRHPNGMAVRGLHYAARVAGRHPAVILSHGFNSCCADLVSRGEAFAAAGIDCYLFDFRGGGTRTTSDGRLSEMMTLSTECADLELVVGHALAQAGTDPDALFLMGESQGGLISVLVSQHMPGAFRGLLLFFPALMIPEASRERLAKHQTSVFGIELSPDFDREAAQLDPWCAMPDYAGEVLLLHGDSDMIVPLAISQKAQELFPHATLHVVAGAGHGFDGDDLRFALEACVAMVRGAVHAGA
ncbi:MAG: alpha/beta hydrolase [Aristaeellaceae bacterium]